MPEMGLAKITTVSQTVRKKESSLSLSSSSSITPSGKHCLTWPLFSNFLFLFLFLERLFFVFFCAQTRTTAEISSSTASGLVCFDSVSGSSSSWAQLAQVLYCCIFMICLSVCLFVAVCCSQKTMIAFYSANVSFTPLRLKVNDMQRWKQVMIDSRSDDEFENIAWLNLINETAGKCIIKN